VLARRRGRAHRGLRRPPPMPQLTAERRSTLAEVLWVSADVTLAVAVIAAVLPVGVRTTLVGFVFLGAVWLLVWRKDDARVRASGLALGGVVIPGPLDVPALARAIGRAVLWAGFLFALIALPYYLGWRWWWQPRFTFSLGGRPLDALNEALGQLLVIALPEEAFYRGYVQSRL